MDAMKEAIRAEDRTNGVYYQPKQKEEAPIESEGVLNEAI